MASNQAGLAAGRRYMKHYPVTLQDWDTKYRAKLISNNEALFNDDFVQFFVPQPTPLINVVTSEILVCCR
jgi:hypothetical protein